MSIKAFFDNFSKLPILAKYSLKQIKNPSLLFLENNPTDIAIDKNNIKSFCNLIHYNFTNTFYDTNHLYTHTYIYDLTQLIQVEEYCDFIIRNTKNKKTEHYLEYILKFPNNYKFDCKIKTLPERKFIILPDLQKQQINNLERRLY